MGSVRMFTPCANCKRNVLWPTNVAANSPSAMLAGSAGVMKSVSVRGGHGVTLPPPRNFQRSTSARDRPAGTPPRFRNSRPSKWSLTAKEGRGTRRNVAHAARRAKRRRRKAEGGKPNVKGWVIIYLAPSGCSHGAASPCLRLGALSRTATQRRGYSRKGKRMRQVYSYLSFCLLPSTFCFLHEDVTVYTDGGCEGNPGPGGWGVVLMYGERRREISGGAPATTNNRMELQAAIEALASLREPCRVRLHTDSQYLREGITQWIAGWKRRGWRTAAKQPVKNADLWRRLDGLVGGASDRVEMAQGPRGPRAQRALRRAGGRADGGDPARPFAGRPAGTAGAIQTRAGSFGLGEHVLISRPFPGRGLDRRKKIYFRGCLFWVRRFAHVSFRMRFHCHISRRVNRPRTVTHLLSHP